LHAVPAKAAMHSPLSDGYLEAPASVAARPSAARFWSLHAPALAEDGRLGHVQVETFGVLCHLFADCEQLAEQLGSEGWITATDKGQAASPVAKLLRDARRDYVALAKEFGLTAAAAARIPQEAPVEEKADTLRAFIDGTA
jgi:phage terminase small subunit